MPVLKSRRQYAIIYVGCVGDNFQIGPGSQGSQGLIGFYADLDLKLSSIWIICTLAKILYAGHYQTKWCIRSVTTTRYIDGLPVCRPSARGDFPRKRFFRMVLCRRRPTGCQVAKLIPCLHAARYMVPKIKCQCASILRLKPSTWIVPT